MGKEASSGRKKKILPYFLGGPSVLTLSLESSLLKTVPGLHDFPFILAVPSLGPNGQDPNQAGSPWNPDTSFCPHLSPLLSSPSLSFFILILYSGIAATAFYYE